MKILKNCGIVAGIHAFVILVLLAFFVTPGCSSSKGQSVTPDAADKPNAPANADVAPALTPAPDASTPAALTPAPDVSGPAPILFSPTRPGTPAASALETQPVSGVVPATTYTVVKGDSLSLIAKKNHLKTSELVKTNNLRAGVPLRVGQKLIIPAKGAGAVEGPSSAAAAPAAAPAAPAAAGETRQYVVKPGETLGSIARKFHVKVGAIATANAISDPAKIHPGQELTIPGARAGGASHPAAPEARPADAAPAPAPAASQDLDAGLQPAANTDVPVIKIDSGAAPAASTP